MWRKATKNEHASANNQEVTMFNPEADEDMPPRQVAMESEVVEKSGDKGETKEIKPPRDNDGKDD